MELWLYASAAGLLCSAALWPFLWHRYRESRKTAPVPSRAERMASLAALPVPVLRKPVQEAPRSLPSVQPKAEAAAPKPAPLAAVPEKIPAAAPAPAPGSGMSPGTGRMENDLRPAEIKSGQTTPGGISPAVVYLQGLKNHLERLDREMQDMRSQLTLISKAQESRFEAILGKLSERGVSSAAPARKQEPAPEGAEKQEREEEPPPRRRGPVWPV